MTAEELEVTLGSLAFGGEAVGRGDDGRVVFVAGGAPGDRVRARVTEARPRFVRAELTALLEPGAARVTPPCPLIDRCGGCPWQHVSAPAQLEAKEAIVRRALAPTGAEVLPILEAPAWLGYRTRARMTARRGAVGFQGRRSHAVVDVDGCLALDPALDAALQLGRRVLGAGPGPGLGEEGTLAGLVAHDIDGARVQLAVTPGRGADAAALARRAAPLVGQAGIVGVVVAGQPALGAALLEAEGFFAAAAGFAQANAAQNQALRRLVAEAADAAGRRVLELYAGDGNFTRDLAAVAASGVAVEGEATAAPRWRRNVRAPGFTLRTAPVERALAALLREGAQFDVVVLDPPRAGAAAALADLARLGAARVVYVSCDPMTLARDLVRLGTLGYRARRAWPVDMMPHTAHVEVVALAERA